MDTATRDTLIMQWQKAAKDAAQAVAYERDLRKQLADALFPNANVGTNNLELGMGYKLKMVKKINYNLDKDQVDDALDKISAMGNEGSFIADRLVSWKPDLSLTEYKKLAPEYKTIIDEVITTSDGSPTLEVVEPKNKA